MTADTPSHSVPKLRFPEFRNAPRWPRTTLSSVLVEHCLGSDGMVEVHSVSLARGVVPQIEHMGRSYAASDTKHYGLVRPYDIVYTRSPLSTFKLGIVKQHKGTRNAIVSPLYGVFAPKNRHLGLLIEAYFDSPFRSIRFLDPLAQKGAKNTIQLSNERFLSGSLFLPEDEDEQQRIADCFSSLDDLIAAEGRELRALQRHKQGLMRELFPRPGETVPRLRFPEFRDAPAWRVAPVGELFDMKAGGTPDRSRREYWDGEVPWVTTSLVDFNVIESTKEFISKAGLSNSSAKVFPKRTVLMALYGQGKTRGKVAILGIEAATNQACAAILPTAGIDPRFVFLNLGGRYEEIRAISNDGSQKNLSQALVRDLSFAYPEQLDEQQRIVDCLTALDAQIATRTRNHEALKQHRQGLRQQLLTPLEGR